MVFLNEIKEIFVKKAVLPMETFRELFCPINAKAMFLPFCCLLLLDTTATSEKIFFKYYPLPSSMYFMVLTISCIQPATGLPAPGLQRRYAQ